MTGDVFRPWRCLHVYHVQLFCLVYVMSNFAYIGRLSLTHLLSLSPEMFIFSLLLSFTLLRSWNLL